MSDQLSREQLERLIAMQKRRVCSLPWDAGMERGDAVRELQRLRALCQASDGEMALPPDIIPLDTGHSYDT